MVRVKPFDRFLEGTANASKEEDDITTFVLDETLKVPIDVRTLRIIQFSEGFVEQTDDFFVIPLAVVERAAWAVGHIECYGGAGRSAPVT